MTSVVKRYKTWKRWRRIRREARYLTGEVQRILDLYQGPGALQGALSPGIWFRVKKVGKIVITLGLYLLYRNWVRGRHSIAPDVQEEMVSATQNIHKAIDDHRLSKAQPALENLDRAMERHLRFARKSTVREYAESLGLALGIALILRAFVVEAFEIPSGSMLTTLQVGDHIFVNKFSYGLRIPFTKHPPKKFFHWRRPQRGQIIVFINNKNVDHDFIKRVIALGGDDVKVIDGIVYLRRQGKGPWKAIPRKKLQRPCRYEDFEAGQWIRRSDCDFWQETLDGRSYTIIEDRDREDKNYPPVDLYREAALPIGSMRIDPLQFYDPYRIPKEHYFVMGDNRTNSGDSRYPLEVGFVPLDYIKGRALVVWSSWGPGSGLSHVRWSRIGHVIR